MIDTGICGDGLHGSDDLYIDVLLSSQILIRGED
jgi:hypothetical protein